MTFHDICLSLKTKYNILASTDLAELTMHPSSAYKFFKSVYKAKYETNEKIILYSNDDINDDLIMHLYQTLEMIDIGTFFVLLVTNDNISYKLINGAKKANQSTPLQNLVLNLPTTKKIQNNFLLPKTICAIPWHNIEIKQDGTLSFCCVSNIPCGNINTDNLNDVFHGQIYNDLRKKFLAGEMPTACSGCWNEENKGQLSIRQHNLQRLNETFLLETIDNPTIKNIDLKFQNTCNFKCLICYPEASSLHAEEKHKYLNIPIKPQNKWSQSQEFVKQVHNLLPDLNNIDMYGGEPFLIKKFIEVLQTAVEKKFAKNIRLHYNSNGSIWPAEFIKYWSHFKEVDIHFSIDAIGKRFEYQRGGNWEKINENILRIKKLGIPNLTISIMPTISLLNVYYMNDVYEWAEENNFQIFVNYLNPDENFSLSQATQDAQNLIVSRYHLSQHKEMSNIAKNISAMPVTDGKKFCNHIRWYDQIRNTNFSDYHYEMAVAMNYIK